MYERHEQYLTSKRNLYIIKCNTRWTTKTGKTIKYLAAYQVMWLLITTVISNHYTIQKDLLSCTQQYKF